MVAYRKYLRKNKNVPETLNVAVIIPAWNEACSDSVSGKNAEFELSSTPNFPVYVVDGASTDNTGEVMTELVNRYGERVVHLRRAKGGDSHPQLRFGEGVGGGLSAGGAYHRR